MSNVPHRYTTPEEDIQTGKIMIGLFSAILVFCFICVLSEPSYWIAIIAPAIASIGGIVAGKEVKETGERRKAERMRPTTSISSKLSEYYGGRNTNANTSKIRKTVEVPKQQKTTFNSLPVAVNKVVSENSQGIKASRIAEITGFPKKDINSYLYSHKDLYRVDDSYYWTKR